MKIEVNDGVVYLAVILSIFAGYVFRLWLNSSC